MSCVLRVSGSNFAVDDFLGKSSLEVEKVWHKGEKGIIPSRPPARTSGFNLLVSDADFSDLKGQIQDAIAFLKCNPDQFLTKLMAEPGVEDAILDFGLAFKRGMASQPTSLPAELIRLAGACNLGIEVSHYWIAEDAPCPNQGCHREQES